MESKQNLKQKYISPLIEIIQLDNEISLALESTPPTYETLRYNRNTDYFNNEPFKTDIG